jgi:hypothetical protein
MRMRVGSGGPAAEQLPPGLQGNSLAGEPARLAGGHAAGGVGEDHLAVAGEPEELPQDGQPPLAGAGQGGKKCLDIVHVGHGPAILAALTVKEDGQVAGDLQAGLNGVVGPGPGAGPAGPLAGMQHEGSKTGDGRPQRPGDGVDPALPAPCRELLGMVGGQG